MNKSIQKIPKKIRELVWNKYIGIEKGISLCECCKTTKISQMSFQCGHIISNKNGGKIHINNLVPICSLCNLSMGTTNMNEFITIFKLPFNDKIFNICDIKNISIYDENFKSSYNKLKHWVYEYNKIPTSNSRDENEYYLNKFVTNMRYYIWCSEEEFEKIKNNIKELENLPYWYWNRKNY